MRTSPDRATLTRFGRARKPPAYPDRARAALDNCWLRFDRDVGER